MISLDTSRKNCPLAQAFVKPESEVIAYWLGFLYADGHMRKDGKGFSLIVQKRDVGHIQNLADLFDRQVKVRVVGKYERAEFAVQSKAMGEALLGFGFTHDKTNTADWKVAERVSPDLRRHFVRGYFDGDGCITRNSTSAYLYFQGTLPFLMGLREYIEMESGIPMIGLKKDVGCYKISLGGVGAGVVARWMYSGSNIALERKKERVTWFKF